MTPSPHGSTILVVDDDAYARLLLEELLSARGYRVLVAEAGRPALDLFRQEAGQVDLVLLDWMLPDISGVEVCRQLKSDERGRLTPVIMVTARDETESKVAGLEGGAEAYVTKPFNSQELEARIHAMLRIRSQNLALRQKARPTTVLIVEDNPAERQVMQELLVDMGYRAIMAGSGREALERFDEEAGQIDLVLLDMMLPDTTGIDLCRRLKARDMSRLTPVIMVTGRSDTQSKVAGLESGADDYLIKPVNVNELEASIHAMLRIRTRNMQLLEQTEDRTVQRLLAQASKLSIIGEMVSEVIHEIRNPLNGIINYAEIGAEDIEGADETRELLGIIRSEGLRIHQLIETLLSFRRSEGMQVLDIAQVLDNSLTITKYLLKKSGVEVVRRFEAGTFHVMGESSQLVQVFFNLIQNALHALEDKFGNEPGKRLFIEVERGTSPAEVVVRVRDNGVGIPPDIMGRIFEPEFTTKRDGRGNGLGLSIVEGTLREHKATIRAASIPGEFAEFLITFPAVPKPGSLEEG